MSAFGILRQREVERGVKEEATRQAAEAFGGGPRDDNNVDVDGRLAIVPLDQPGRRDQFARVADNRLSDQVALIRSVSCYQANHTRLEDDKVDDKFRADAQAATDTLHGVDVSTVSLSHACIRTMKAGNILDV